jgi:tRNA pseudouridine38-40 synthase
MKYRYFIKLAYNGARYHGWQIQENAVTVQQVVTEAIQLMWIKDCWLHGCGRTDTGVNAKKYYAHFDVENELKKEELDYFVNRLNNYLPADIVIFSIFPVPSALHARHDAVSRTYEYHIHTRKDPFLNLASWYVYHKLDIDLMNRAGEVLKEYEDFTSFSKANERRATNLCVLTAAGWEVDDHRRVFRITANRFLHDMVRAIVGTMVELGRHKINLNDLRKIIESKDRCKAGESVPAKGLYLSEIVYLETLEQLL